MKFKFGNKKIGKDTLIINMGKASDCPSLQLGYCKLVELGVKCYALKPEQQYPDVVPKYRDQQFKYWRTTSAEDIAEALNGVIKRRRTETKYIRFNESGDFWTQKDVDKLNIVAKRLKEESNVITYGYTARMDLKYPRNRHFIIRGSGYTIPNTNGKTIVVLRGKNIPKGYVECPGSCVTCSICKQSKKINVAFRQH